MAKTGYVTARIEPDLKQEAESIFSTLGVSTTEALTMFYRQVTMHQGLPFPVRIPNAETIAAIKQSNEKPSTGVRYESFPDLLNEIDAEIADESA